MDGVHVERGVELGDTMKRVDARVGKAKKGRRLDSLEQRPFIGYPSNIPVRTILPHPCPLPKGEGELLAGGLIQRAIWTVVH